MFQPSLLGFPLIYSVASEIKMKTKNNITKKVCLLKKSNFLTTLHPVVRLHDPTPPPSPDPPSTVHFCSCFLEPPIPLLHDENTF